MHFATKLAATGIAITLGLGVTANAAGHGDNPFASHIAARQGAMNIMAFNISILGGMARGNIDYNADAAAQAAGNLATMAALDGRPFFPQGSDSVSLGEDVTHALPAIWENPAGFGEDWMAYVTAATALADVAGDGLDALRGGIGAVGQSCGGCHRDFRVSDE